MGTVFLLAAAFFVCSTLISMRSVFADPIVDTSAAMQKTGRQSPRNTNNNRANVARTTVARPAASSSNRTTVSRGTGATRTISQRSITPTRATNTASRGVTSRSKAANRTTTNRAVRARTATSTPSRVSATGSVMAAGSRATATTSYSYLSSKLYTGSYANIIDSTTGLISADAYSNCLESYYTCMDEICTARSDTKGRCACAGRATNFLEAETALERANEELITLSGQLSLLIATKGKGKDLAYAFSLTDAEKVMNCVSWKDAYSTGGSTKDSNGNIISKTEYLNNWCKEHSLYDYSSGQCTFSISANGPDYCSSSNNNFGFDIKNIDGSSSDILAQLRAWADAKDLAKEYTTENNDVLTVKTNYLINIINNLNLNTSDNAEDVSLDSLANKWGYKLFEYAHNNVCGRVLDSCFNGIYEACGTPPTVTESDGKTKHAKCANGATSSCPFNYNSYISVTTTGDGAGDVKLNERSAGSSNANTSASCFGYSTSTATTVTGTRTVSSTSSDPYYSLRGPVADARRSIMQKYLLDANSACDVYGNALKQTAQNINYQKIAAEQALQQKRLEFKQEEEAAVLSAATAAIDNFNECISEIWDCYEEYENEDKWTVARIKAYCSQVSQVPHCYETMICSPLQTQLTAVIDEPDSTSCTFSTDYAENTCRNVVTISEILYGTGVNPTSDILASLNGKSSVNNVGSANVREACLRKALNCNSNSDKGCLRGWDKVKSYSISYFDSKTGTEYTDVYPEAYYSSDLPTTIEPTAPTKSGFVFAGWCESAKYSNGSCSDTLRKKITLDETCSGSKAYYAIWTAE